jgi:hypothetical protein
MKFSLATTYIGILFLLPFTVFASQNVSISATVGSDGNAVVSAGGAGVTSIPLTPAPAKVSLSGRAYPLSHVTVLRNGIPAATTVAGPDAKFSVTVGDLAAGVYTFSLYSEDNDGVRSDSFTISVSISSGTETTISGVFLSPTISLSQTELTPGDTLTVFGQTVPGSTVTVKVSSADPHFYTARADSSGAYLYNVDTSILAVGDHEAAAKAAVADTGEISSFSQVVRFAVGKSAVQKEKERCTSEDYNCDGRVSLVDFSILSYYYKRTDVPKDIDLNSDGKITLIDFSILAYYWTG